MACSKLICPQCQSVLKCSREPRSNRAVTCPKCALQFFPSDEARQPPTLSAVALLSGVALVAVVCVIVRLSNQSPDEGAVAEVKNVNGSVAQPSSPAESPSAASDDFAEIPATSTKEMPKPAKTYADTKQLENPSLPVVPVLANGPNALATHPRQAEINAAIANGVAFLKQKQTDSGTWADTHQAGYAALGGLALLESGVPADNPVVQKAAEHVRTATIDHTFSYMGSLAILFLDRLGDQKDEPLLQSLALRLLAGQNQRGAWSYQCPILTAPLREALLASLRSRSPEPARNAARDPHRPLFTIPGLEFHVGEEDNSNTQFALLGLWAARRHGLPTDEALRAAAARLASTQYPDGGWGYDRGGARTGSTPAMTCVGLLGLAMGHGLAMPPESKKPMPPDERVSAGLKYLGNTLDHRANLCNLYFLWSLERVGELYQLRTIGNKDWYDLGACFLLDAQQNDGAWSLGNYWGSTPALDTCFALLFLKRSNLVRDLSERLPLLMRTLDPDSRSADRGRSAPASFPERK